MYLEYQHDGHFEVATGAIDKSDGIVEFRRHMWIGDTHDGGASEWITTVSGGTIERWHEEPHHSAEVPHGWTSATAADALPTMNSKEKLRAHCHCGGVEFFITRPTQQSLEAVSPWPDLLVPFDTSNPVIPDNPRNEPWWLRSNNTRYLAGTCACNSCRQATGFEFVEWAFVPAANIVLADGQPFKREFGSLKAYRSSADVTRRFCGGCGASVFWDGDFRPTLIDVAVGLLDAPTGARAEEWLEWETNRVSFREFAHNNALIDGLEEGMRSWDQERKSKPSEE